MREERVQLNKKSFLMIAQPLAVPELSVKVDLFSAESRKIVFSLLPPTSAALIKVIMQMLCMYPTYSLQGFKALNKLDYWQLVAVLQRSLVACSHLLYS